MPMQKKPTKPESEMTQLEKAKLAAERVKAREQADKDKPKEQSDKPKPAAKSPNAAAVKPAKSPKRPAYFDGMTAQEQLQEMRQMEKEEKAYDAARQIKPEGFKRGGMVTARGQGKVSRTRKTRIC